MNNCRFNHPRPIFCPFIDLSECENRVINPELPSDFGFLNNTVGGTFTLGSAIPVFFVNMFGNSMLPNGSGAVILTAGTYEVNYFVAGLIPASGTLSVGLTLNGVLEAGSQIDNTQIIGNAVNLTRTIVISVPNGSTLALKNLSSDTINVTFASLYIRKL